MMSRSKLSRQTDTIARGCSRHAPADVLTCVSYLSVLLNWAGHSRRRCHEKSGKRCRAGGLVSGWLDNAPVLCVHCELPPGPKRQTHGTQHTAARCTKSRAGVEREGSHRCRVASAASNTPAAAGTARCASDDSTTSAAPPSRRPAACWSSHRRRSDLCSGQAVRR